MSQKVEYLGFHFSLNNEDVFYIFMIFLHLHDFTNHWFERGKKKFAKECTVTLALISSGEGNEC